jgi:nitrogen-specific signal transduction histidine kinase
MSMTSKIPQKKSTHKGADYFTEFWDESWIYIKTVVDVLREPVLLLDKDLHVLAANESFYTLFQVKPADTEGKHIYKLGNGQWNIPALCKLLDDILPRDTFFKGFEVTHEFPSIGEKTIVLNARHIHTSNPKTAELFPTIIMVGMDDITGIMSIAKSLSAHTNQLETTLVLRTTKMEAKLSKLEKQMSTLSKIKKE